jgi:hypothetical protein
MKHQIERLSPHQNGKVFAVLMAVSSLMFLVPFFLIAFAAAPEAARPPLWIFALMPVFYLLIGYAMVAIGCWLYNRLVPFIGGIEYTSRTAMAD